MRIEASFRFVLMALLVVRFGFRFLFAGAAAETLNPEKP
jgi:hypothetical protein